MKINDLTIRFFTVSLVLGLASSVAKAGSEYQCTAKGVQEATLKLTFDGHLPSESSHVTFVQSSGADTNRGNLPFYDGDETSAVFATGFEGSKVLFIDQYSNAQLSSFHATFAGQSFICSRK